MYMFDRIWLDRSTPDIVCRAKLIPLESLRKHCDKIGAISHIFQYHWKLPSVYLESWNSNVIYITRWTQWVAGWHPPSIPPRWEMLRLSAVKKVLDLTVDCLLPGDATVNSMRCITANFLQTKYRQKTQFSSPANNQKP